LTLPCAIEHFLPYNWPTPCGPAVAAESRYAADWPKTDEKPHVDIPLALGKRSRKCKLQPGITLALKRALDAHHDVGLSLTMVSLIAHAVLGILVIAWILRSNPTIFRRTPDGPLLSAYELVLYVFGAVSVVLGWYFNVRFVQRYGPDKTLFNPLWGDGSWAQYVKLMFANFASSSAGQDYTISNVVLLPLMTVIDGRRRGIARPWLFFVSSLFTSFAFAWAFYLAATERQRRLGPDLASVGSVR
jgi:hypothetical protein